MGIIKLGIVAGAGYSLYQWGKKEHKKRQFEKSQNGSHLNGGDYRDYPQGSTTQPPAYGSAAPRNEKDNYYYNNNNNSNGYQYQQQNDYYHQPSNNNHNMNVTRSVSPNHEKNSYREL